MFKKLFSIHYENKLILELLDSNTAGLIAANIVGPLISIVVLFDYVPKSILAILFIANLFVAILRVKIKNKLYSAIEQNIDIDKNLFKYLIPIFLTSLLYGTISWVSILHNVPDINIFIIGVVIISLTAGSIATLGSVFIAFLGYITLSIIPLSLAYLYHQGMMFNIFTFILLVYMVIHISSGYRLFLSHKSTIELENRFKTIFNKSSDGIVIIKDNKFSECNETVINMFGYPNDKMDEFINTKLSQLMPKTQEDGKSSMKKMLQMLQKAQKATITFEWIHIKRDGEKFWAEITLSPIELSLENVVHGVWRDISERKKLNKKL